MAKKKFKKWVHWMKLCNISFREQPEDVANFLRSHGYMEPDHPYPTEKALKQGLARNETRDGKIHSLWNKTRYLSLTREDRKQRRIDSSDGKG